MNCFIQKAINIVAKKTQIVETTVSNGCKTHIVRPLMQVRPGVVGLSSGIISFFVIYGLFERITFTQIIISLFITIIGFFYQRRRNPERIKELEEPKNE